MSAIIGAVIAPLDPDAEAGHLRVVVIASASPADLAGLRADDVITSVDGTEVTTVEAFRDLIDQAGPGRTIHVTVTRGTESMSVPIKLAPPESVPLKAHQPE